MSMTSTQYLSSAFEGLDELFLSIFSYQWSEHNFGAIFEYIMCGLYFIGSKVKITQAVLIESIQSLEAKSA